jgi:hypothetical protein
LKVEVKDHFLTIVRCVNACMLVLLPKDKQHWGQALIAEQDEIEMVLSVSDGQQED